MAGGVIGPLSFLLALLGQLLQDMHQCLLDCLLPMLVIPMFAISLFGTNLPHITELGTTGEFKDFLSSHHLAVGWPQGYLHFPANFPAFQHSKSVLAMIQAEYNYTTTSADSLGPSSQDCVIFLVGSVDCVVISMVSVTTVGRFQIWELQVPSPHHFDSSWATISSVRNVSG